MDILSRERRSWNMSRIQGKNTKPEIIIRSLIHRMGYRFRLHVKELPGIPDIVLPKYRTAIFVHGCFWHRHTGCQYAYMPKSRIDFWQEKFRKNVKNDKKVIRKLKKEGWKPVVIWECEISNLEKIRQKIYKNLNKSTIMA